ncbi:MAG: hypothetical protein OXI12_11835, partial [Gammaproteobacteria bacterium]|nr:hypothetical protein [Gammaproteobacteria bacterium]
MDPDALLKFSHKTIQRRGVTPDNDLARISELERFAPDDPGHHTRKRIHGSQALLDELGGHTEVEATPPGLVGGREQSATLLVGKATYRNQPALAPPAGHRPALGAAGGPAQTRASRP